VDVDRVEAGDPQDIARRLRRTFADIHARRPAVVAAAPGRVNLIGEHTDYNGGLCLPIALPHSTYAAIAPRADDVLSIASLQQETRFEATLDAIGPGRVRGWPAYVAGVVWALNQASMETPGMDVVVDGRVPVGAGLSSSAALECASALAMCVLSGGYVDDDRRRRLVEICMRAEREVAGAPTGGMDQTVSLLARRSHALLLDCGDWSATLVPWNPSAAGIELVVVDTRSAHALVDGGYGSRREDCERAAELLGVKLLRDVEDQASALASLADERLRRRARHVFTEIARVRDSIDANRAADFEALGQVFGDSHASLRDDFEVSCDELDLVVDVAVGAGALGARMTGGGFGGSAIMLVRADDVERVERAVADAFAQRGWPAPGFLRAVASAGARVV
jgi:galactokinase